MSDRAHAHDILLPICALAFMACGSGSHDGKGGDQPAGSEGGAGGTDTAVTSTTSSTSASGGAVGGAMSTGSAVGGAMTTSDADAGGSAGAPETPTTTGSGGGDVGIDEEVDCSESEIRTGPPAGKEFFSADPIDQTFPFSVHWVGEFSDDPRYVSMTSIADFDNDGDLDFASGQREDLDGGMVWWEYCAPDHWVRHAVGVGHESAAGGNAMDVDGDGWVDLLAGNSWYRNPTDPRESSWERFDIGAPRAEELIVGEVTGDDRAEVLYVWRPIDPQYWAPGEDPTEPWTSMAFSQDRQQQGGAIGDIDGDGDNDILVGSQWWYENVNGDGSDWVSWYVVNDFEPDPLTHLGDMDGDGDTDLVMCTHFGSQVAWVENGDGAGSDWTLHVIASDKEHLHAIVAADFDNDGDLDIFVGQNVGPSFIFENEDGAGSFVEHQIADNVRAHEARVGDVDCDGDLDIVGKPWGDPNEGGETGLDEPKDHNYLQNMLVEGGGPAKFERAPYEILHAARARVCP